MPPAPARRTSGVRDLLRCDRGLSAVEFAIFGPILCFGLLATVDIGLSVALRMELDRNVRAGAQAAITLDNPQPAIETIVRVAAGDPDDLDVDVQMECFCRISGELVTEDCTGQCPLVNNWQEPLVFFEISATRPYSGPLFGERTVTSGTRVQIR